MSWVSRGYTWCMRVWVWTVCVPESAAAGTRVVAPPAGVSAIYGAHWLHQRVTKYGRAKGAELLTDKWFGQEVRNVAVRVDVA